HLLAVRDFVPARFMRTDHEAGQVVETTQVSIPAIGPGVPRQSNPKPIGRRRCRLLGSAAGSGCHLLLPWLKLPRAAALIREFVGWITSVWRRPPKPRLGRIRLRIHGRTGFPSQVTIRYCFGKRREFVHVLSTLLPLPASASRRSSDRSARCPCLAL